VGQHLRDEWIRDERDVFLRDKQVREACVLQRHPIQARG
jgi:hypothetical protein